MKHSEPCDLISLTPGAGEGSKTITFEFRPELKTEEEKDNAMICVECQKKIINALGIPMDDYLSGENSFPQGEKDGGDQ